MKKMLLTTAAVIVGLSLVGPLGASAAFAASVDPGILGGNVSTSAVRGGTSGIQAGMDQCDAAHIALPRVQMDDSDFLSNVAGKILNSPHWVGSIVCGTGVLLVHPGRG